MKTILISCLALSLSAFNVAATEQQDYFELGTKSFNQGKYKDALLHFNKMLTNGIESEKLVYSLGSTHYKLKNYKESRKHFLKLTTSKKYGALAYYNLGLIAHKENDDKSAIKYFNKSKSVTQSINLRELSSKQIYTLTKANKTLWGGYASAGYGYDSNITSAPSGVATNESGSFVRAIGLADLIISGNKTDGIVAKATFTANDYIDTSFNDDKSLAIDISFRDKRDEWRLAYDAGIKQSTYGDDDFQRTYRFTINAKKKLQNKDEVRFRYRYEDINSLSKRFDYLDGSRQKLRTEYHMKWPNNKLRLQYELELNDRQNLTTATREFNYSPTRNKIAIKYDSKFDQYNAAGIEIEYRDSDYEETTTQNRSDQRLTTAIKYSYAFDKNWKLRAKVKYKNNDSNEPGDIYDYERTITTIDLSRIF